MSFLYAGGGAQEEKRRPGTMGMRPKIATTGSRIARTDPDCAWPGTGHAVIEQDEVQQTNCSSMSAL